MEMTKEMKEMMERTMEQYLAAYWQRHATPEQEERRVKEGKTFKGAYGFCKSVAEKMRRGGAECVAMPDDLAYWILMHYMESEDEGAKFRTPEEVAEDEKRKVDAAERKRRELEEKAAKMNEGSLLKVTADDLAKAERDAEQARKAERAARESAKASAANAEKVEAKVAAAQMTLF